MENLLKTFSDSLIKVFEDWIECHKEIIGEKWCKKLNKEIKKIKENKELSIPHVIAYSMWIFNVLSNFGIMCGLAPNRVTYFDYSIPKQIDEKLTKRLLTICSSCLALQYLPRESRGKEKLSKLLKERIVRQKQLRKIK